MSIASKKSDAAVAQDDLAAILRAVGLGAHARPYSPHKVVQQELLPHLRAVMGALEQIRMDYAGHCEHFNTGIGSCFRADSGKTVGHDYYADRVCSPCLADAALANAWLRPPPLIAWGAPATEDESRKFQEWKDSLRTGN